MKIFGFRVKEQGSHAAGAQPLAGNTPQLNQVDLVNAFRVSENEKWWRAVLQLIDEFERETIEASRKYVGNPNMCISAVGGGESLSMLRERLIALREQALATDEHKNFATD